MSRYVNSCTCERCRARGMMGPAILVTLGVLLLLGEMHVVSFDYTWPVLLIVIGVVKVLQSNASMYGHQPTAVSYPGYPVAPVPPTPPAAPTAPTTGPDQGQVSNG
jgi:LiaI-LiaF-like transmembrane region